MSINLYDYQKDAVSKMKNGCILCGGVGSGKSRTSLAYIHELFGGTLDPFTPMKDPADIYIITIAKKRDNKEWEHELYPFLLSSDENLNTYSNKVVIDSWNNIKKYTEVKNAFFIFDEQRVVGKGVWTKSFLKITKQNRWILLSATPGDTWNDYVPVFLANGFFRSRRQFNQDHVVFAPYTTFPKIDRYLNVGRLIRLRDSILVDMDFRRPTTSHHIDIFVDYDKESYRKIMKTRWDFEKDEPIENASALCYALRKNVNMVPERFNEVRRIVEEKRRAIIFYNFDYELEALKNVDFMVDGYYVDLAEWNGHKHQPIPDSDCWVYLVQYNAGSEGWNCIDTDTIIFFSQNYSYRTMVQAAGRIDRLNTPFKDLYFYHLKTKSDIDLAINRALKNKKKFNETKFVAMKAG